MTALEDLRHHELTSRARELGLKAGLRLKRREPLGLLEPRSDLIAVGVEALQGGPDVGVGHRERRALGVRGNPYEGHIGEALYHHVHAARVEGPAEMDAPVQESSCKPRGKSGQVTSQRGLETEPTLLGGEESAQRFVVPSLAAVRQPVVGGERGARAARRLEAEAVGRLGRVAIEVGLDSLRRCAQPVKGDHRVLDVVGEEAVELDVVGAVTEEPLNPFVPGLAMASCSRGEGVGVGRVSLHVGCRHVVAPAFVEG